MIYTTDDLITSVKTRALVPSSQTTFSDENIISLMNEDMYITLVPDIMTMREDFFRSSTEIDLVSGISKYPVPERAIGNVLIDVLYKDSSGNRRSLPRVSAQDLTLQSYTSGYPFGYILEGDYIKIMPVAGTGSGDSLEVWYYQRPNKLVLLQECAVMSAVVNGGASTTATLDTDVTSYITTSCDIISGQSPLTMLCKDVTVSSISSTSVTLPTSSLYAEDDSTLLIGTGDYICAKYTSPVPQIPQEFHPILAQMAAARLCEAMGDLEKLAAVNGKLSEMRKAVMSMIANRVDAAPKKIVNRYSIRNHFGTGLRSRSMRGF